MRDILFITYLSVLTLGVLLGLYRYKGVDDKGKIILYLLIATVLTEGTALILTKNQVNQEPLYHLYSIIEIVLTSLYFFKTIKTRYYKVLIVITVIFWIVLGSLNAIFYQPLSTLNTNILLLESVSIIPMSIYALYVIFLADDIQNVLKYPLFWVWACFLLYWSTTFFFWAYVRAFDQAHLPYENLITYSQGMVNIINYIGLGYTFLLYPKPNK